MFNNTTRHGKLEMSESLDSKYTVADILSSMASGDTLTPTFSGAAAPCTTVSETTPLLTPTTLASIEQTFAELQSVPATTSSPVTVDPQPFTRTTESGFVPPVINMIKQEYVDYSSEYGKMQTSDPEWLPPSHKRTRMSVAPAATIPQSAITPVYVSSAMATTASVPATTPRRHTGPRPPRDDTNLTPDELRKRKVRRERNKQAAAKCRQRRVDLTNKLLSETEDLEDVKNSLENDIQNLQQQKEQLEFLLQAHKPLCHHMKKNGQAPVVKTEKLEMASNTCSSTVLSATSIPQAAGGNNVTSTVTTRPNTLPLTARTSALRSHITEATGVSITTPSSGVPFNFGLESMMDGHTGLTPLTGGPSCASQVHRNSSDSSPSDALASPTTLMAL